MDFVDKVSKAGIGSHIHDKIIYYHNGFITPINGSIFEEIFNYALMKCGMKTNWTPGSHKPGKDISIADGENLSLKGARYFKSVMRISGCRTSRNESLDDKLHELDETTKNHEYVIICERTMEGKEPKPKAYGIWCIDSNYLSPTKFEWETSYYQSGKKIGSPNGYKTKKHSSGIEMKITSTMSGQLWYKIPRENLSNNDSVGLIAYMEV